MNIIANFEDRASSSRGKHEGESSFALCDRLGRTRDNSQRQLPTDHDYAVPTREYQTDQSSLKPDPTAARPVLEKQRQLQKQPHGSPPLTRSLHIRATHSSRSARAHVELTAISKSHSTIRRTRSLLRVRSALSEPPKREAKPLHLQMLDRAYHGDITVAEKQNR